MLLDSATERAILDAVASGPRPAAVQPALTYLANTLACKGREIPYSTVTAIDFADRPPLGPFLSAEEKPLAPLRPNEMALNSWAADDLHARLGDMIQLSFFQPENSDGQIRQQTRRAAFGGHRETGRRGGRSSADAERQGHHR